MNECQGHFSSSSPRLCVTWRLRPSPTSVPSLPCSISVSHNTALPSGARHCHSGCCLCSCCSFFLVHSLPTTDMVRAVLPDLLPADPTLRQLTCVKRQPPARPFLTALSSVSCIVSLGLCLQGQAHGSQNTNPPDSLQHRTGTR